MTLDVLVRLVHGVDPLSGSTRQCETEPGRVEKSRLQTQFIKFCHYSTVFCTLVVNFGAVILHNPNRLAVIFKFPSPPCLSDEKILRLVPVQAEDDRPWSLSGGRLGC